MQQQQLRQNLWPITYIKSKQRSRHCDYVVRSSWDIPHEHQVCRSTWEYLWILLTTSRRSVCNLRVLSVVNFKNKTLLTWILEKPDIIRISLCWFFSERPDWRCLVQIKCNTTLEGWHQNFLGSTKKCSSCHAPCLIGFVFTLLRNG